MMDLSFRWPHPRFATPVGVISARLHTFDNVYGMDPDFTTETTDGDGSVRIASPALRWAGGEQAAAGSVDVVVSPTKGGSRIQISGFHADGIRSLAITLHDVPRGVVEGVREGRLDVPDGGRIIRYPNGWFDLASPSLAHVGSDPEQTLAIRSLAEHMHPQTFAVIPHFDDVTLVDIELIIEADASRPAPDFAAPAWVVLRGADAKLQSAVEHRSHVHSSHPADPWETRDDVPDWMREVSLVATLHGQHFTGKTFLDYEAMLEALRTIAREIDGRRVLAYLPGWEGRYYRNYGSYRAEPTMGGDAGFQRLVDGAHELGVHVMPMFGANIASRDVPGFERWAEPGILRRASGLSDAGSVDWDGSRHYDYGGGALINLAYEPWRRHLVAQIARLQERFGFDATFLDITAMYSNDPNGDSTEGLRSLARELREAVPGHLVAGEAWYDAISSITPLVQTGHHDTVPVYHDLPDEELFTRSNRSFGHVCLGDPAFHSSGVHEAGYVAAWRLPVRRGVIPTLGVVNGTLQAAPERVALIINDAHEYAECYLSRDANSVQTKAHSTAG
ncbi:hypothetical protein WDJ51_12825 [Rathayibacter sp. YIM 133350]|uniref:hypothetical protein n=1 Tax=Rathayibacter sp. YIM 133350 TaxID=3131992 RepID=UPI00307EC000